MTTNKKVDVGDIVVAYLEREGYHGLYNPDGKCACLIKDIGACENLYQDCIAGWLAPCDCGEHDWHITSDRGPHENMGNNKKGTKDTSMATMRDTIEIVGPGCQLLINQQGECVVFSVESWGDETDRRMFSRLELDPMQADRLSGFLSGLALKAQEQINQNEGEFRRRDEYDQTEVKIEIKPE